MKKVFTIFLIILGLVIIVLGLGIYKFNFTDDDIYDINGKNIIEVKEKIENYKETKDTILSETEARIIAEQSCIKGGEVLSVGIYNENSKTWWYDTNLNATREGCNPSCVVSEETKKAEINWRCTGLKEPVACTMDAKQCPDGSYVGRSGPDCVFVCSQ